MIAQSRLSLEWHAHRAIPKLTLGFCALVAVVNSRAMQLRRLSLIASEQLTSIIESEEPSWR